MPIARPDTRSRDRLSRTRLQAVARPWPVVRVPSAHGRGLCTIDAAYCRCAGTRLGERLQSSVFNSETGPQQQRHLPLETAHRLQRDTPPVRALNLWSRRHGDVITRHMRNATIALPCKARPNEATRCPHGWPCPARTPCALHPIAHCSLSITIECAGSATFTVLPWTRAPLNATGATACGCA